MTESSTLITLSVADQELTPPDGQLSLVEWTAPPPSGSDREYVAPLHVHHGDDEIWYVLEGTLGFLFDGDEFEVSAGGAACARAGVAHTYWNAGTTEARYLIAMPTKIRELIAALHDPALGRGRSAAEIFAAYDSQLLNM